MRFRLKKTLQIKISQEGEEVNLLSIKTAAEEELQVVSNKTLPKKIIGFSDIKNSDFQENTYMNNKTRSQYLNKQLTTSYYPAGVVLL